MPLFPPGSQDCEPGNCCNPPPPMGSPPECGSCATSEGPPSPQPCPLPIDQGTNCNSSEDCCPTSPPREPDFGHSSTVAALAQGYALSRMAPGETQIQTLSIGGGSSCHSQGFTINLMSGNLNVSYKLPSAVISDAPMVLHYNSLEAGAAFQAGLGWRSLLDQYLQVQPPH